MRNEFQKDTTYVYEVCADKSKFRDDALLKNPFFQENLLTENSYLQIIKKGEVDTQIATMGTPYALTLNEENFKTQDDLYKFIVRNIDSTFTLQEIRHNSYTISVSFCELLKSFIISSSGQTIVCQDRNDIQKYLKPHACERVCKVSQQFFDAYQNMNYNLQMSLQKDLIHRSLVGCRNSSNYIEWYSIMEHYQSQRILPPEIVKRFLNHYNLEPAKSIQQQTNLSKFPSLCDSIYNQLIDQYHDYFKGKTLYFWKNDKYLGNCYIPSKHFEILREIKTLVFGPQNASPQRRPGKLFSQFTLNQLEYEFYEKCLNFMLGIPYNKRSNFSFMQLSNITFNCVHKNLDYIPQRCDQQITLAQCLSVKPIIVVLIPVGINGMGYEDICQIIYQICEGVKIVSKTYQVNDNSMLYLFDQICSLKRLQSINDELKQLPYDVRTVALYPECSHYYLSKKIARFPFSFKFIMFCLLQVLDHREQVNQIINQLKEFENQNLNHLPCDYQISCHYMPQIKETDDLYSEIVESDFKAAFSHTNDYLIESLSQYRDTMGQIPENHLWDQARRIINEIEEKVKVNIAKKKQKYIRNQTNKMQYGLYINNPNWEEIDNFIFDCLEIILQNYPRDVKINIMYQQLQQQLFQGRNSQFYQKQKQPYMLSKKQDKKQWSIQVQVVVIAVDGIIILQPQDLGLNLLQDIPIYSNNIEVIKSEKIAKLVRRDVEKLQDKNTKEGTLVKQELELKHQSWSVFIVKWKPINIELVENLVV
ncbi:unnamed protein product (macronuclear) [Paramecium tetraurelia]|uniref:PAZ domain-containing protein n=1 Tax=Paramecium tetraurelia TaxID=5888 RepID=A0DBL4_PARTE|nr:uncharacterized protein GSPATT00015327001 [Paramecium tetraurelia]CAK80431.1 unnamed protein product [Paramecium tetraurelia]|eukprot:XP_001447828.1 hypothetical protein (macronuclear) [Paramecium tetraurelia strain d4-2]